MSNKYFDKTTRVRINLTLHVPPHTLGFALPYLQFNRVLMFNLHKSREGTHAQPFNFPPAELPPPVPALWRGLPTCALLQCPAGVARLQCHSDQQLCKETMEIMTYQTYLKMIMRSCINARLYSCFDNGCPTKV